MNCRLRLRFFNRNNISVSQSSVYNVMKHKKSLYNNVLGSLNIN